MKDGGEQRDGRSVEDGGDLVRHGEVLSLAGTNGQLTLWAEAIGTRTGRADTELMVWLDPDGDGPLGGIAQDRVRFTAVDIDVVAESSHYSTTQAGGVVDNLVSWWPGSDNWLKLNLRSVPDVSDLLGTTSWTATTLSSQPTANGGVEVNRETPGTGKIAAQIPLLGITQEVYFDFPDVKSMTLNQASALHPAAALEATTIYDDWATEFGDSISVGDGTTGNAAKHAYWSALITYFHDETAARDITTAYEYDNKTEDGTRAYTSTMDLYNNAIGIAVGNAVRAQRDAEMITDEEVLDTMKSTILSFLLQGQLYIEDPSTLMIIRSDGRRLH